MLSEINTEQLNEWQGFYLLEPWGEEWMRTAFGCAASEMAFGGGKFDPQKYMPVKAPEREQSIEEMVSVLMAAGPRAQ